MRKFKYFSPSVNINELSKTRSNKRGYNKSYSIDAYSDVNAGIITKKLLYYFIITKFFLEEKLIRGNFYLKIKQRNFLLTLKLAINNFHKIFNSK